MAAGILGGVFIPCVVQAEEFFTCRVSSITLTGDTIAIFPHCDATQPLTVPTAALIERQSSSPEIRGWVALEYPQVDGKFLAWLGWSYSGLGTDAWDAAQVPGTDILIRYRVRNANGENGKLIGDVHMAPISVFQQWHQTGKRPKFVRASPSLLVAKGTKRPAFGGKALGIPVDWDSIFTLHPKSAKASYPKDAYRIRSFIQPVEYDPAAFRRQVPIWQMLAVGAQMAWWYRPFSFERSGYQIKAPLPSGFLGAMKAKSREIVIGENPFNSLKVKANSKVGENPLKDLWNALRDGKKASLVLLTYGGSSILLRFQPSRPPTQ
jgi:hypothetical protein